MKFLHAADIHLDSPLAGLARERLADIPPGVLENPTRRAFAAMVDLAIREDVAFVLIAGDLYDADWKDYSTGLFFAQQMRRLARPCFLIRGNHDARSVITRSLTLPANVREFSSRTAHSIPLTELGVALHGRSFPDRAVPEDLSASYPVPAAGLLNIGLLHTSAEDPGRHDTYAPCGVAALRAKGYDYWALGHIHDRRELSVSPRIVFPGNTQGRHVNEPGAKGVYLVEVQDRRIVGDPEFRAVDVLRWARPRVDLDGVETMAELIDRVRDALAAEVGMAEGRPVIARVRLEGATSLHGAILRDPAAIEAECRNVAFAVGDIYVEGVRGETRAPRAEADHSELRAAFAESLQDPVLMKRLLTEFGALAGLVPRGAARGGEGAELPRDEAGLRNILPQAWEAVMHELSGRDPA